MPLAAQQISAGPLDISNKQVQLTTATSAKLRHTTYPAAVAGMGVACMPAAAAAAAFVAKTACGITRAKQREEFHENNQSCLSQIHCDKYACWYRTGDMHVIAGGRPVWVLKSFSCLQDDSVSLYLDSEALPT
jgi:hypothetical protein